MSITIPRERAEDTAIDDTIGTAAAVGPRATPS